MIWLSRYCLNPPLAISQLREPASITSPERPSKESSLPAQKFVLSDSRIEAYIKAAGGPDYKPPNWFIVSCFVFLLVFALLRSVTTPSSLGARSHLRYRCEQAAGAEVCDTYHDNSAYPVLFTGFVLATFGLISLLKPNN